MMDIENISIAAHRKTGVRVLKIETITKQEAPITHTHSRHVVPKDALKEILQRQLCKRVLSRSSEST